MSQSRAGRNFPDLVFRNRMKKLWLRGTLFNCSVITFQYLVFYVTQNSGSELRLNSEVSPLLIFLFIHKGFIKPGDLLLNVEGDELTGMSMQEVKECITSAMKRWSVSRRPIERVLL